VERWKANLALAEKKKDQYAKLWKKMVVFIKDIDKTVRINAEKDPGQDDNPYPKAAATLGRIFGEEK
jgi:hypothetical protein